MTPAQCRAARALIDMTQLELAEASGLGLSTIVEFEKQHHAATNASEVVIQSTLEAAGIDFIAENGGGAGVRLRKPNGKRDEGLRPDQLDATNDD